MVNIDIISVSTKLNVSVYFEEREFHHEGVGIEV